MKCLVPVLLLGASLAARGGGASLVLRRHGRHAGRGHRDDDGNQPRAPRARRRDRRGEAQAWLDAALARDPRPFTFVLSHTPAFRVGRSHDAPFPDLYSHGGARDRMWESLRRAGTLAYFCGHIHLYCRATARGVEQVAVGNGGANPAAFDAGMVDPALALHAPVGPVPAAEVRTGYLLVRVDEAAGVATGTMKLRDRRTGAWQAGDTFPLAVRR